MIYGYIRVSSDKQTVENQRYEINNFVTRENLKIDGWIEETISGTKNYDKRELGNLLKQIQKGDLIICAELSRLGRNFFMIMEILNICMTKECRVWTQSRTTIDLARTSRVRCWLSVYLPRLREILSVKEPKKRLPDAKLKAWFLVGLREAKPMLNPGSYTKS